MVGGKVIEVRIVDGKMRLRVAGIRGDEPKELAVFVKPYADCKVEPGDDVWWQGRTVYWTPKDRSVIDVPLPRIGYSFDPQSQTT